MRRIVPGLSALPIIMLLRQAREASMARTREGRTTLPAATPATCCWVPTSWPLPPPWPPRPVARRPAPTAQGAAAPLSSKLTSSLTSAAPKVMFLLKGSADSCRRPVVGSSRKWKPLAWKTASLSLWGGGWGAGGGRGGAGGPHWAGRNSHACALSGRFGG